MKKISILALTFYLLISSFNSSAQPGNTKRAYHWYFGDGAGIDFSSGQAVADTTGQVHTNEGCATISDEDGYLLFYTDGSTVWNKNHQIMPNGTGLMGHYSGMQNSIIIPKPNSKNIYYIFTSDAWENSFANGVRYSTVDMSLNSGLGDITQKNYLLMAPAHEQLAAVHHANCNDVWVVCHKLDEEKFYAYLVTENGVDTIPVITQIGNASNLNWGTKIIKFSPNGKRFISWSYWAYIGTGIVDTVELYDFNKNTGIVSNRITLTPDTLPVGYIFSPDNTKLYVSGAGASSQDFSIYQYNLTATDIESSKQIIYISPYFIRFWDAQYSPIDSIIYFIRTYTDTLSIIHNPNALGMACNFEPLGFTLNGRPSRMHFPNFITSYFNKDTSEYNCNIMGTKQLYKKPKISVYPNPFTKLLNIDTYGKKIIWYKLYDQKGSSIAENTSYTIKQSENSYVLTNKNLKAGVYFLSGKFTNNEEFFIKLIIN